MHIRRPEPKSSLHSSIFLNDTGIARRQRKLPGADAYGLWHGNLRLIRELWAISGVIYITTRRSAHLTFGKKILGRPAMQAPWMRVEYMLVGDEKEGAASRSF